MFMVIRLYASSPKKTSPKLEIAETWAEIVIAESKHRRNKDRPTKDHRYEYHRHTDRRIFFYDLSHHFFFQKYRLLPISLSAIIHISHLDYM